MAPLRGWARRGMRLEAKVPHGKWNTLTFLAALRHDRIEAPWLIDGPINGERFRIYVEKVLVPTLRPNDIVVMDNLGSHKGAAVRRAIRAAGAKLFFLPKYSPDLNPIEQVFAKLKHLGASKRRRTMAAPRRVPPPRLSSTLLTTLRDVSKVAADQPKFIPFATPGRAAISPAQRSTLGKSSVSAGVTCWQRAKTG